MKVNDRRKLAYDRKNNGIELKCFKKDNIVLQKIKGT